MIDSPPIDWHQIDTLLLDMDGTLLDLAFDNYFWLDLVPATYAEQIGTDAALARAQLFDLYSNVAGSLAWYCLDHWTRQTGLDLRRLKWLHRHLIGYLPGAVEFLRAARSRGLTICIVTNAHPDTLAIKMRQTGLNRLVDTVICSHLYGAAKEHRDFWAQLQQTHPFELSRTMLIDDSLAVMAAARRHGLSNTLAIRRPDSRDHNRDLGCERSINGVDEIVSSMV